MIKKHFFTLAIVVAQIATYAQTNYTVHFDSDQYLLNKSAQEEVLVAINDNKEKKIDSIALVGHTDRDGSVAYNKRLSLSRCKTVQKELQKSFSNIPISFIGESELKPISLAGTDVGKALNRRVEIIFITKNTILLTKTEEEIPGTEVNLEQSISYDIDTNKSEIEQVLARMSPKSEVLSNISGSADTIVTTAQGTKILMLANCFRDHKNRLPREINLKIQEYYSLSSILSAGLTTITSDGRQLETRGMVNISATNQNGDSLHLKNSIFILFPKEDSTDEDYRSFQGIETDSSGVVWEEQWERKDNKQPDMRQYRLDISKRMESIIFLTPDKNEHVKTEKQREIRDRTIVFNQREIRNLGQMSRSVQSMEAVYLLTTIHNLGWINCDHFWSSDEEKVAIQVPFENEIHNSNTQVYCFFKDKKSIIRPEISKMNSVTFTDIPVNSPVTILAIRTEEGKVLTSFDEFTVTSADESRAVNFVEMNMTDLQKKLKEVGF